MEIKMMVICLPGGFFYKYKSKTKDINKAKVFTSSANANKIAEKLKGSVREIFIKN